MLKTVIARYDRILTSIEKVEKLVGLTLLAFIVVSICFQVFTRAIWGKSQIWVEELCTYGFIWAAFIGAAIGLKHRRHISISTFISFLGRKKQFLVAEFSNILIMIILLVVILQAPALYETEIRCNIIAIPFIPRFYVFSLPLIVSLISMLFTTPYLMLNDLLDYKTTRGSDEHGETT